ncbi:MAG TPA: hypothetical protein DHV28_01440 [Ignavibacteriales bacterium]|nr:hypothetical protein [Ignavibacteriales bacterium]
MKKLFLITAVFSALLLLIGCQDNSITDPFSSGSLNKNNLMHSNSFEGIITLDQKLADPDRINDYFLLSGKIKFTETLFDNTLQDKAPQLTTAGQEERLDISVDAALTAVGVSNADKGVLRIDSKSDDIVFVSANGTDTLVKAYPVLGRKDKMELVCTFDVTENGLTLKDAILTSAIV